jgi:hypothetical protein
MIIDTTRVFAEETSGVYQENVIGSAAEYTYADGGIVRGEEILGRLNLGPGKPEHAAGIALDDTHLPHITMCSAT